MDETRSRHSGTPTARGRHSKGSLSPFDRIGKASSISAHRPRGTQDSGKPISPGARQADHLYVLCPCTSIGFASTPPTHGVHCIP